MTPTKVSNKINLIVSLSPTIRSDTQKKHMREYSKEPKAYQQRVNHRSRSQVDKTRVTQIIIKTAPATASRFHGVQYLLPAGKHRP